MSEHSRQDADAGAGDVLAAMRGVVDRQRGEHWRALHEERLQRLLDLGVQRLGTLIELAGDDSAGVEERVSACWFLGRLGGPQALPALCDALAGGPTPVRLEACDAMVELGDTGAVGCLGQALAGDADVTVRSAAAYGLGWLRDRRAVPALIHTLRNTREDAGVRGMAAEQLGRLEDPVALPDLRRALRDERPEVRFWAAYALGCYASSEVIADLEDLARSDTVSVPEHGSIRQEAAEAIEAIRARDPQDTSSGGDG